MTLRDQYKNRKPLISHEEREEYENMPEKKRSDKVLDICLRVNEIGESICENIRCESAIELFEEIEKRKINISDIISDDEYEEFKKKVIKDGICFWPTGKPERIWDINNNKEDMKSFRKKYNIPEDAVLR